MYHRRFQMNLIDSYATIVCVVTCKPSIAEHGEMEGRWTKVSILSEET